MSRIELHCPSCGYDVPLTLLPPPTEFTCPGCNETMPRNKLTRLKVLHRNIAGAVTSLGNDMTAVVVGSNSFFDATQATGTLTISNCVFQAGDLCVVCVADDLASGGSGGPGVVTIVGVGAASAATASPAPSNDLTASMWFRHNVSGTHNVTVGTFILNPTACAGVVVAIRQAKTVLAEDQSASTPGTGPPYSIPPTSALAFANDFGVIALARESSSAAAAASFSNGYQWVATAGTAQAGPPNDCSIDVAVQALTSSGPTSSSGAIDSAVAWAAIIDTFKHI